MRWGRRFRVPTLDRSLSGGQAEAPNAAYFFLPELQIQRKWWCGPPGPRGTPSSRCRNNDISTLQGVSRPTGASAADQGVRPTKQVRLPAAEKSMRPLAEAPAPPTWFFCPLYRVCYFPL